MFGVVMAKAVKHVPHWSLNSVSQGDCNINAYIKWLYLLNGMLYFFNSCTVLKPIDYHLVSDLNVHHSILHTLL
jgi:hypothetical protein